MCKAKLAVQITLRMSQLPATFLFAVYGVIMKKVSIQRTAESVRKVNVKCFIQQNKPWFFIFVIKQ